MACLQHVSVRVTGWSVQAESGSGLGADLIWDLCICESMSSFTNTCTPFPYVNNTIRLRTVTWDFLMTWLASSWMGKLAPSSEEKESMGESVPEVSTMLCTEPLRSEKAWQNIHKHVHAHRIYIMNFVFTFVILTDYSCVSCLKFYFILMQVLIKVRYRCMLKSQKLILLCDLLQQN